MEEPVNGFPLMIGQKYNIWQEVVYAKQIFYCTEYCRQGHSDAICRAAKKVHDRSTKEKDSLNEGKKVDDN